MTNPHPAKIMEYTVTMKELADLSIEYIEEMDRENPDTRLCAIVSFAFGQLMAKVTRFAIDKAVIEKAVIEKAVEDSK